VFDVRVTQSGKKTEDFLQRMTRRRQMPWLDSYGQRGVDALANATPKDTRETSKRWRYKITERNGEITISWHNDHVEDGKPIAVLIQYGHATGTGGYVQGRDYINPAMQPIFDELADEIWRRVKQ
jgi:hypothetical protein